MIQVPMQSNKSLEVLAKQLNKDLLNLSHWLRGNKLCLNVQKTELKFHPNNLKLESLFKFTLQDKGLLPIQLVKKYPRKLLDEHLQWTKQLSHVKMKLNSIIGKLRKVRYNSNAGIFKITYHSLFGSHLLYTCQLQGQKNLSSLNQIRILHDSANPIYKELNTLKFKDLIYLQNYLFMIEIENNKQATNCILLKKTEILW